MNTFRRSLLPLLIAALVLSVAPERAAAQRRAAPSDTLFRYGPPRLTGTDTPLTALMERDGKGVRFDAPQTGTDNVLELSFTHTPLGRLLPPLSFENQAGWSGHFTARAYAENGSAPALRIRWDAFNHETKTWEILETYDLNPDAVYLRAGIKPAFVHPDTGEINTRLRVIPPKGFAWRWGLDIDAYTIPTTRSQR